MRLGDGEEFEGTRLGIFGSCGLLVPGVHDVVCCLLFDVRCCSATRYVLGDADDNACYTVYGYVSVRLCLAPRALG